MKRIFIKYCYAIITILSALCFMFASCDNGSSTKILPTTYTVNFDANGHGTYTNPITNITYGQTIIAPIEPTAEGLIFQGWYKEAECITLWDFDIDTVTKNTTLYAKWIPMEIEHSVVKTSELNDKHFWMGNHSDVWYCEKCDTYFTNSDALEKALNVISIDELDATGIPTVIINTKNKQAIADKENWIIGNISISDNGNIEQIGNLSIRGRGNTTWSMPKKPYNLKLDEKTKLLGMKKAKKWALLANYSDKTLLRNWFSSYLGNNVFDSSWSSSCRACNFVLNGDLLGNYTLFEKVEIGSNRVDISDISENLNNGFILEVNARMDEKCNFISNHGIKFSVSDPDEPDGSNHKNGPALTKIINYINEVEDYLFSTDFASDTTIDYIDVDSFIDWYLINELTKNNDAQFYSSVYMYYSSEDQKLHMGPIWDFDISCGNINYNECDNPEGAWIINAAWYKQLIKNKVFADKLKARWNNKLSQVRNAIYEIPDQANLLSNSAEYNFRVWNILGKYVWPNANGYAERTTYQSEIDYLVAWLNKRITWLNTWINNL